MATLGNSNTPLTSVGGTVGQSIHDYLLEQAMAKRQSMLDGLLVQDRMAARAKADMDAARQATADKQANADRAAAINGPNADLTNRPDVAATLRAGGYNINAPTLQARVGDPLNPQTLPSATNRAETYTEQQARQAREDAIREKNAAREDTQAFNKQNADANRASAKERADADRQMRETIAQMQASSSVETRALGNQLKQLQIQAQQDKMDAAKELHAEAKKTITQARSNVRDLAQGLLNDPELAGITGMVEGRRDTFLTGAATDALARYNQLVNTLSLQGRSQLKGQGAVSDFEGRMLEKSATALNRAAGPDAVRQHLQDIVNVFSDTPSGSNSGNTTKIGRFDVEVH